MPDSYASGADLVLRYDWDMVGDCATDDRETLNRSEVLEHPSVIAALNGASGEVNASLAFGGKYLPEDLQQLEGADLEYLKDLVCTLAMVRLGRRRGENALGGLIDKLVEDTKWKLDALRRGENIFNLPEVIEASIVDTDGPTVIEISDRNDLSARMAPRYLNGAQERLPRGQGGKTE